MEAVVPQDPFPLKSAYSCAVAWAVSEKSRKISRKVFVAGALEEPCPSDDEGGVSLGSAGRKSYVVNQAIFVER